MHVYTYDLLLFFPHFISPRPLFYIFLCIVCIWNMHICLHNSTAAIRLPQNALQPAGYTMQNNSNEREYKKIE